MANEPDLWNQFRPMRRMRRMRRMFELFPWGEEMPPVRQPLVDVEDKGKTLQVTAELPGIDKKDIDISIDEEGIELKAETKSEQKETEKEGYYYHERSYQSFFRRIPLPTEVLPEKAKASFNNGVLSVEIPKKHPEEKPKGHKVNIE